MKNKEFKSFHEDEGILCEKCYEEPNDCLCDNGIKRLTTQRNKLNREISILKKATLNQ